MTNSPGTRTACAKGRAAARLFRGARGRSDALRRSRTERATRRTRSDPRCAYGVQRQSPAPARKHSRLQLADTSPALVNTSGHWLGMTGFGREAIGARGTSPNAPAGSSRWGWSPPPGPLGGTSGERKPFTGASTPPRPALTRADLPFAEPERFRSVSAETGS